MMGIKVLLVAEQKNGKLSPASLELITAARKIEAEITTAILADNAASLAAEIAAKGGGQVFAVSHPSLKFFNDEIYAKAITALINKHQPKIIIGPATFYGKSLFARLAALNGGPMVSDATALSMNGAKVAARRPAYGGNVIVDIEAAQDNRPFFLTIRPKIYEASSSGEGQVVAENLDNSVFDSRTNVREMVGTGGQTVSLNEADIIVAAGRGIRGPENIAMIKKFADSLGAALGASRAIVDAGWIEYPHQVGQTGKTVNPKLYFAIGISGAIQHLVGMQTSKTIVAINRDKDAPIFKIASYGIVGDLFEMLPALTAKFETVK